jgi:hypothetical protein
MPIFGLEAEGLERNAHSIGCRADCHTLVFSCVELPHSIAFVSGAMPAADFSQPLQFKKCALIMLYFCVSRVWRRDAHLNRNSTLERIDELIGRREIDFSAPDRGNKPLWPQILPELLIAYNHTLIDLAHNSPQTISQHNPQS